MNVIFTITNKDGQIIAWARNRIDAIGNKEYFERKGINGLTIHKFYHDDPEYKEIMNTLFTKAN